MIAKRSVVTLDLQLSSSRTVREVRVVRLLLIASHERTELRSLRERFCSTNSFSTTNPKDRSLIVVKVSSITDPSLIQWTNGRGRPVIRFLQERAGRYLFRFPVPGHSCMCHVMCRIVVDDDDEEEEGPDHGDDDDATMFAVERQ